MPVIKVRGLLQLGGRTQCKGLWSVLLRSCGAAGADPRPVPGPRHMWRYAQVTPSGVLLSSLELLATPSAAANTAAAAGLLSADAGPSAPDTVAAAGGAGARPSTSQTHSQTHSQAHSHHSHSHTSYSQPRSTWPSPKSSRFEEQAAVAAAPLQAQLAAGLGAGGGGAGAGAGVGTGAGGVGPGAHDAPGTPMSVGQVSTKPRLSSEHSLTSRLRIEPTHTCASYSHAVRFPLHTDNTHILLASTFIRTEHRTHVCTPCPAFHTASGVAAD